MRGSQDENTWNEWAKYVLKTLDRLESRINKNEERIQGIREDNIKANVKVGLVYGAIALVFSLITYIVIELIKK